MNQKHPVVTTENKEISLTLVELCTATQLETELVIEMVQIQVLEPVGESPQEWHFDAHNLKRAKTAASFHRDLEINLNGIALALDLLEQIDELEKRIQVLEKLSE